MPKRSGDENVNWGHFAGVGLQVAVGVTLGYFVGDWLDRRYGWSPVATIAGSMLGLAGGLYLLIKDALRINRD